MPQNALPMKPGCLFILLVLFLLSSGSKAYGQLRNLSVISYDVVSCNVLSGKLTLKLTIRNDSTDFTIRSFSGLVYHDRLPLVHLTAANLFIPHDVSTIGVVCDVSRCTGVSIFRLAQCFIPFNISDYTVDVNVAVQYPAKEIEYKEQKNISMISRVELR